MPASLKVDVNVRPLVRVGELTHQNLAAAIQKLADETVEDAKSRAPVLTGALRDSIEAEVTGDLEVEIHDGVSYGIFQEFGTRFQPGHPFLTPAVESAREKLPELVGEALNRAAAEAGR